MDNARCPGQLPGNYDRPAQFGVELAALEIRVDSLSDDRGMLGMDDSQPAGPLSMKISVRIGSPGVEAETLQSLVAWAEVHSPVGEPLTRLMLVEYAMEIIL